MKLLQNYVGSTLAHLPFVAVNEVLNIIHQIDSIVAVDGNQVRAVRSSVSRSDEPGKYIL